MSKPEHNRVAVIGLGACGLVTLKNLREAGFDAIGFDSNSYVGGLWNYTKDPSKTSVLKSTVGNLSKHVSPYTDFAYRKDIPDFPTAQQTQEYLESYAEHFDLMNHAKLGTKVDYIGRQDGQWMIKTTDLASSTTNISTFAKVVVASGLQVSAPRLPAIPGIDTFTGKAIHSTAYKDPSEYSGKRVVVVGLGNTGPDIAVDLIGHASEIWLSHSRGNAILKRSRDGIPGDFVLSLRAVKLGGMFNKYLPSISQKAAAFGLGHISKKSFNIPSHWGLLEPQSPVRKNATMNDHLVPALHKGELALQRALTRVSGDTLTFADGVQLSKVDSIIFSTGFRSDFSYLDADIDPTRNSRTDWSSLPGSNGRKLPRLYQGIFSLDYPDSLAFLGTSPLTPQAFMNFDLCSQAVAQIWAGKSSLPSAEEMQRSIDDQHEQVCRIAATGPLVNINLRNNWDWFKWCDAAAGLGIVKRTGWSVAGWKLWWEDRELSNLVNGGIFSPHIFRLFDEGKRPVWEPARKEIERINADAHRTRSSSI